MSTTTASAPVAVIGAGPVGLTAAILLARHGIDCEIYERHPAPYALPRAVHLDDEVLRILQAAKVDTAFRAISRPALGMQLLDARHRVLARFLRDEPLGVHGHPQANMFDQPELERLLRDRAAQIPGIRLHGSTEVTALTTPPPGTSQPIEVTVHDLDTGQVRAVTAAAVLGCDGATSLTRTALGARPLVLGAPQRWLVVDVRCPVELPAWDGVHQVCDPQAAATYMRIGADRYRWEFRLDDAAAETATTNRAALSALLAPWTGTVPTAMLTVLRTATYTFRAQVADRWRSGRVFLLGDAAHLTPPFIGQGLGAGLRDAHNLTWKLARVLTGRSPEALLDTYQAERQPHAKRLIRTAVLIGRAMTSPHPATTLARTAALAVGRHTGGLSPTVLDSLSPALNGGRLTHHRSRIARGPRPGDLCPQPPIVSPDHRPVRLDDALGTGFALLTTQPPTPYTLRLCRALPARIVTVTRPSAEPTGAPEGALVDVTGQLHDWLRGSTVLLRPDRVVLAAQRGRDTIHATITRWSPALIT
ncbi:bifunctional 3-(3-hydroxy-phenyl)propionate/3-hydroxycinnamic acid hydroxylase [Streptomyces sp. VRA16 Mangrove soil]|uniref:bifunctional 3-(3-hydroxy-phenyl)propionate/3-hydroxycinnamic acid hydroxylase MhpA n=1 Tax=Streptomyces sp. VRA16 Mangrove soil TaxID=2817434 RepID=UPI001A9D949D|nr:bifunctional 3-(3-hydroxy-phenyl)propionate/3-hydroxycinnamic acid hydroxylase [Streptomyces sp. VRA16 Mangrove soil]MBO1332599.1 bifunctional 3-(3-hydroxy-phenyl)propionate/3-hydroxycinnamic acid hydroxylase [Streptomyces sp. VRA16 Mangrove soil]